MSSSTAKYRNVLDKGTLLPVSAVVGICTMLFMAWSYLDTQFDGLKQAIRDQGREIKALKAEVRDDRWTMTDHRLWVAEFRRRNPTMEIPPVKED